MCRFVLKTDMSFFKRIRHRKFSENEQVEVLLKEVFRKSIHLCSAFVTIFAKYFFSSTIIALAIITILYTIFEFLRINGKKIFLVSAITDYAARKRDRGGFVLGPVTLSLGIITTLLLFPQKPAQIGILALAFGDGLSGLIGKCFGKNRLKFFAPKTLEGCLTCFIAVFISALAISKNFFYSIILAMVATIVEVLPLKDFDNLLIPIVCAFIANLFI